MKQQVLKALANPARIFYVPYSIAILNFVIQFIAFVIFFVARLIITGHDTTPLWFLFSVMLVHSVLATFSKREPQLGQIISAKMRLIKYKVSNKLAA